MNDPYEVCKPEFRLHEQAPANRFALGWRFLLALAMLLIFAGDGLRVYFSGDDVMNLYKYIERGWGILLGCLEFWSPKYYRPVGGVAYMGLYGLFGFNALAFKIAQFSALILNLGLAWCVGKKVLGESRLALFATLLIAYHAAEGELYYSFGTIYDILCFTLVLCGFAYWMSSRRGGRYPGLAGLAILAAIQILAISSKEVGVCLPALIFAWEALNGRVFYRNRPWIELRLLPALAILGMIVLAYIIGKGAGAESLVTNPLYKPNFTTGVYLTRMSNYLGQLTYTEKVFTHFTTALFLAGGVLVGAILRLRAMVFGWIWFIVCTLPVAFIPPRAGFVLYVPALGLAMGVTAFLAWAASAIRLPRLSPAGAALFIAATLAVGYAHATHKKRFEGDLKQYPAVRQSWTEDLAKAGPWKRGSSILFLADPFPEDWWDPLFLTSLYREDPQLAAARAKKNLMLLSPGIADLFTEVFDYRKGRLTRVDKKNLPAITAAEGKTKGLAAPRFGIFTNTDAWWWTEKDFGITARCPESKQVCRMDISFVTPIGPFETGEKRSLGVEVDGDRRPDIPIAAQFDPTDVSIEIPGGRDVPVTVHVGRAFTPDKLNGDNRPLAIIVAGVHLN